jgi:hypothetical protein
MPFSFVTKNMVFSYTSSVNAKKDADKQSKDKVYGKEMEGKTVEEGKQVKPWMSAL